MTMDIIILSLLFVLLAGGAYFLSAHVRETREKMFKEMSDLEASFEDTEDLHRIKKKFQPVAKAEPVMDSQPAPTETVEAPVVKPKKKKTTGRRGRPAKPKGDA
jgi:cytochrome c556